VSLTLDIATKYSQGKIMKIILDEKIGPHATVYEEIHLSFCSTNFNVVFVITKVVKFLMSISVHIVPITSIC